MVTQKNTQKGHPELQLHNQYCMGHLAKQITVLFHSMCRRPFESKACRDKWKYGSQFSCSNIQAQS